MKFLVIRIYKKKFKQQFSCQVTFFDKNKVCAGQLKLGGFSLYTKLRKNFNLRNRQSDFKTKTFEDRSGHVMIQIIYQGIDSSLPNLLWLFINFSLKNRGPVNRMYN